MNNLKALSRWTKANFKVNFSCVLYINVHVLVHIVILPCIIVFEFTILQRDWPTAILWSFLREILRKLLNRKYYPVTPCSSFTYFCVKDNISNVSYPLESLGGLFEGFPLKNPQIFHSCRHVLWELLCACWDIYPNILYIWFCK